jgi:hypothetical protein
MWFAGMLLPRRVPGNGNVLNADLLAAVRDGRARQHQKDHVDTVEQIVTEP